MTHPYDPEAASAHLAEADPRMARLIDHVGPCGLEVRGLESPFRALLRAIVYQQLSGQAAATIHGRVADLFPERTPTPERLLALPDKALRGAGLSRGKLAAARDLAAKTLDGTVPAPEALRAMENDAVVEHLTRVHGVGPWTAHMLLIFDLGRPDVLPTTDLGVRRGLKHLDGLDELPAPSQVTVRGQSWRPYRSVASWYLWRAADLDAETLPG